MDGKLLGETVETPHFCWKPNFLRKVMGHAWKIVRGNPIFCWKPNFLRKVMGHAWKIVRGNPIFCWKPNFLRKVMGHAWKIDGETAENSYIFVGKYHGKDSIDKDDNPRNWTIWDYDEN